MPNHNLTVNSSLFIGVRGIWVTLSADSGFEAIKFSRVFWLIEGYFGSGKYQSAHGACSCSFVFDLDGRGLLTQHNWFDVFVTDVPLPIHWIFAWVASEGEEKCKLGLGGFRKRFLR